MSDHPPAGDFYRTVVGTFSPRLEDLDPSRQLHGLNLQAQYLYGGLRAADGTLFGVERKFYVSMTGGLWLMSTAKGNLNLDPRSLRSTRGEVRRQFTDTTRHWADHLMHKVGKELAPVGEQPLDLTLTDEGISYSEGDLLAVQGPSTGAGIQFLLPMRDEQLYYVSQAFWVQGEVVGTPVDGCLFFDHVYWQHGREWKEYRFYQDLQVSWAVFGNRYPDGAVEWGHVVKGRRGVAAAVVLEGDEVVAMSSRLTASYVLDEHDFVAEALFEVDDQQWEFAGDPDGRMIEFSKARWGGYKAQAGKTRRRGDDRVPTNGFTWLECFAERIRGEKLVR